MNCPHCGTPYHENAEFCIRCGMRREPDATVQYKEGTHWIPLLIMAILALSGLLVYFATAEGIPLTTGDPVALFRALFLVLE